ncbi:uncharacterized protein LOC122501559 [Leptopilina heterotoma]|nr:uncharacterized protein LOC122501559 [Leptopilina heterotoma]
MVVYTEKEYLQMIQCHALSGGNCHRAAQLYREKYPDNQRFPGHQVITRTMIRINEGGPIKPDNKNISGRPRSRRTAEVEEKILEYVREHPRTGLRAVAKKYGVSYSMAQATVKEAKLHDYSFRRVHTLSHRFDRKRRLKFCKWLVKRHERDPTFINNILFTDECRFAREGPFNYRNEHYWSDRNLFLEMPHSHQEKFSVHLWAGI